MSAWDECVSVVSYLSPLTFHLSPLTSHLSPATCHRPSSPQAAAAEAMRGAAAATRCAADATAAVQHLRTSIADAATGNDAMTAMDTGVMAGEDAATVSMARPRPQDSFSFFPPLREDDVNAP